MKRPKYLLALLPVTLLGVTALAQTPRLASLYPAGGRAGQTVEVTVNGGGLVGAENVLVFGASGVKAEMVGGGESVDTSIKPLFDAKCTTCHESRSPANRTLGAEQWASTVDRMINARGADIKKDERDKIVSYVQALARAGKLNLKVTIDKDATPGMREMRLVGPDGVSTSFNFEVSDLPEMAASTPDAKPADAPMVTFPLLINGTLSRPGQRDYYKFVAKKGEHITFNLKGFRLNPLSNQFFNPVLYLYNEKGREITKSLGKFNLDPVIDWTCPVDGTYYILVRDMLWKGNPASVYRLAMGELPYEASLSPFFAKPGESLTGTMVTSLSSTPTPFSLQVPEDAAGVTTMLTAMGEVSLLVRDLPDGGTPVKDVVDGLTVELPALFRGEVKSTDEVNRFKVVTTSAQNLELYAGRLGSPFRATVTIRNDKNEIVRTDSAETEGDLFLQNAFPRAGKYTVEIASSGGTTGAYCWEANGSKPDFALAVNPDTINLPRDSRVALVVRATRRQALTTPIALLVNGLPRGVLVEPIAIPPDDDKAILVVNAREDARPGSSLIQIEGISGGLTRRAVPSEVYRIQNQPRLLPRKSQALAITKTPHPFKLSAQEAVTAVTSEIKIPVTIERDTNFTGQLQLQVLGLPPGVNPPNPLLVRPGQDEATITIRVNPNAPFMNPKRAETLPRPQFVIVGIGGNIDQDGALPCTKPITLIER